MVARAVSRCPSTAPAITLYALCMQVSIDTSARRPSKSPCWAVYRWSQGPATGRQAWLRARRLSLPLVATGDRGLLCVELTAPSQRIETLASLPNPPPSPKCRGRVTGRRTRAEWGFTAVSVALNTSLRGGKKLGVHHSSAHESTLMMSHAAVPVSHTTILYYQFSYKRPYLLKKGESRLFFHAVDWAVPPRESRLLNHRATNNLLKTLISPIQK